MEQPAKLRKQDTNRLHFCRFAVVPSDTLGYNWDYNLNDRLKELPNGDVNWYKGSGRLDVFERVGTTHKAPAGLFVKLTKNPDNTFTIREKNGREYNFNLPGADGFSRISSIVDRNGNTMNFHYDGNNNLIKVTDTVGRDIHFSYDNQERIIEIRDFANRAVEFSYDGNGDLVSITRPATSAFPQGVRTEFTYSSGFGDPVLDHNLLTVRDARGNLVIENTYDGSDRVIEQRVGGDLSTFSYDAVENITVEIDANGNVREYEFNEIGNVLRITRFTRDIRPGDPAAYITSYEYNSEGLRTKTISPLGNVTRISYDESNSDRLAQSNILEVRQKIIDAPNAPSDIVTSFTYEATYNLVKTITDPLGDTTQYSYDTQGNLTKLTDTLGNETVYSYDSHGQLLSITEARGNTTNYSYDSYGNRANITDAVSNETEFSYDTVGNLTSLTDAKGNTTNYTYDELNQLLRITSPDQAQVTQGYDANGNRISVTDQKGNTTEYSYDILNRLNKVKEASGGITQYSYDSNGNRLSVTDAKGNTTNYSYDELDRLYQVTSPSGFKKTYSYDLNSNRTVFTDANGNTINYTYDAFNRLTQTLYPDNSTVSFSYDSASRRIEMLDSTGTTTYSYDNLNRLVEVTSPGIDNTISYEYDSVGNRVKMTNQDGGISSYEYDALNRLTKLTNPQGKETSYQYDEVSNLTTMNYPNNTRASYTFDNLNRLLTLTNQKTSGDIISSYAYEYDPAGMREKVTLENGDYIDYSYDSLNQLTSEVKKKLNEGRTYYSYQYSFDPVGNRLSLAKELHQKPVFSEGEPEEGKNKDKGKEKGKPGDSGKPEDEDKGKPSFWDLPGLTNFSYSYDEENRLLQVRALREDTTYIADYEYDNNGNLIKKTEYKESEPSKADVTSYSYDYENRLISVGSPSGTTTYVYDGDGNRIRKTSSSGTIDYINDINLPLVQVIAETDGTGNLIASYTIGNDLISMRRGAETFYYHYDALGSVGELSDEEGEVVSEYVYDAYGNLLAHSGGRQTSYNFPATTTASEDNSTSKAGVIVLISLGLGIGSVTIANRKGGLICLLSISLIMMPGGSNTAAGTTTTSVDTTGNVYGFTGEQQFGEADGLIFLRARYYDPKIGRFISKDPYTWGPDDERIITNDREEMFKVVVALLPREHQDPATLHAISQLRGDRRIAALGRTIILTIGLILPQLSHPYAYALNNPVNVVDPSGKVPLLIIIMAILVGLAILALIILQILIILERVGDRGEEEPFPGPEGAGKGKPIRVV